MVVMSGEVSCWSALLGFLVGLFSLSMIWSDSSIKSAMVSSLWSSVVECHRVECALTSPVIMLCCVPVRKSKVFFMRLSSSCCVRAPLGGMYMFVICMCLLGDRCIFELFQCDCY